MKLRFLGTCALICAMLAACSKAPEKKAAAPAAPAENVAAEVAKPLPPPAAPEELSGPARLVRTTGQVEYKNDFLAIRFADAPAKGGLLGITDVKRGVTVLTPANDNDDPILWALQLSKAGSDQVSVTLTNRDAKQFEARQMEDGKLLLVWTKISGNGSNNAARVTLVVDLQKDGASVWDLTPDLYLEDYTFESLIFPYAERALAPKKERMLFPTGNVGSRLIGNQYASGNYPSYNAQTQFFGIYRREKENDKVRQGGVYIGLQDPGAVRKHFELIQNNLKIQTFAEDTSVAGKSRIPSYPVVIAPSPDAWHSSALYRKWAKKQLWCSRGSVTEYQKKHADSPDPRNVELWILPPCHNQNVAAGEKRAVDMAKRSVREQQWLPGVKMAVHWYNWNVNKFDHKYPNFFPVLPDSPEAGQIMHDAGMLYMPYINGRLWDTAEPDYDSVKNEGVMKADGTRVVENYYGGKPGSAELAAMCPTSPSHRAKIAYAVDRLVEELKIDGIYIDQITSMTPLGCYDPNHGHPLNGGTWWQQSYREMLQPIVAKHRDHLLFFSENAAEPYLDTIDIYLLWGFAFQDDFPSLMAVYNQETTYMGSLPCWDDSRIAFVSLLSRNLTWNIQPGWMRWLHGTEGASLDNHKEARAYTERIIRMRRLARPVMENGLPVGDVTFAPQPDKVEMTYLWSTWNRQTSPPKPGKIRPVYGVWWQSDDGATLLAAVANVTDKPYTLNLATTDGLFCGRTGRNVVRIAEDGTRTVVGKVGGAIPLEVAPEALFLLEIQ